MQEYWSKGSVCLEISTLITVVELVIKHLILFNFTAIYSYEGPYETLLTAASITRLQFSEWYGTSKQKFKLFIFLFTNNCPLYAWHGHVAQRHISLIVQVMQWS